MRPPSGFCPPLFAAVDAILGAIFTLGTQRNVMSQPKYKQIIKCGLTALIVFLFPFAA